MLHFGVTFDGCIITQCSFNFISLDYNCTFHLWVFNSSQMLTGHKRASTVSNAPHCRESRHRIFKWLLPNHWDSVVKQETGFKLPFSNPVSYFPFYFYFHIAQGLLLCSRVHMPEERLFLVRCKDQSSEADSGVFWRSRVWIFIPLSGQSNGQRGSWHFHFTSIKAFSLPIEMHFYSFPF